MEILNKHKDIIPNDGIYIGRGSLLGNPFIIGKHGDRDAVIDMYAEWTMQRIVDGDVMVIEYYRTLLKRDSKLVCFCRPQRCHGEVISATWDELNSYPTFDEGLKAYVLKHSYHDMIPVKDGVTHINIYSKGKTELGRLLSNFAHTPFDHQMYGRFESIEGFWYWLSTGERHDELRHLHGYTAKEAGRKYSRITVPDFIEYIKKAIRLKIYQNPVIYDALKESTLPFRHYYWYGDECNAKVIQTRDGGLICKFIEEVRQRLQANG